jgi:hypothetical protein
MSKRNTCARATYASDIGVWLASAVLLVGTGCGGGGPGTDIQRKASDRPDVTGPNASSGRFLIPAEVPFNITSFKSGQSGAARGTSEQIGTNGAVCRADAREGGSAWGEVQLGYCLDNATGKGLQAVAKVRVRVKGSIAAEEQIPKQNGRSVASNGLLFFVKDTYGLILRQEPLYSQDLEKGSGATTTSHDLAFDVRLEPDRGYYFAISGRSDAQAAPAQAVNCSLEVSEFGIELSWQPVSAAQSTKEAAQPAGSSAPASARPSPGASGPPAPASPQQQPPVGTP